MHAVAKSIIVLASSNLSGSVHGQILNVDGGKEGKLQFAPGEANKLEGRSQFVEARPEFISMKGV